jgi:hypothetical protein
MIRTPKRNVHLRLPQTDRPDVRVFFAEEAAARRRRQTSVQVETPHLAAALIARGRRKESDPQ